MKEVIVVVEGGMVVGVYANTEDLATTVLDADTDDGEREAEIREEVRELERRISAGELRKIN